MRQTAIRDTSAVMALVVVLAVALIGWSSATASAQVVDHFKIPLEGLVVSDEPCLEEDLVFTGGALHVIMGETVNDNNVSRFSHFQPQGATLVGAESGDQWVGTGVGKANFSESLTNGSATMSMINNFKLIGKGKTVNLLIHSTINMTTNAQGEVTSEVELEQIKCR